MASWASAGVSSTEPQSVMCTLVIGYPILLLCYTSSGTQPSSFRIKGTAGWHTPAKLRALLVRYDRRKTLPVRIGSAPCSCAAALAKPWLVSPRSSSAQVQTRGALEPRSIAESYAGVDLRTRIAEAGVKQDISS